MCNQEIEEPGTSRGKLIECPHCSCYVAVPSEKIPVQKADASAQPGKEDDIFDESFKELQMGKGKTAEQEPELVAERKLPWIFDIFLYPISSTGLSILGMVVVIRFLLRLVVRFLGEASQEFLPCLAFFGLMWGIGILVRIVLYLYLYWYLCECIRESAAGGIRAPEIVGRSPGLGDFFSQVFKTSGCFLLFPAPAFLYFLKTGETDTIFWCLTVNALFFFPMSLLAVVMFESWWGLNPIMLISSIFSTLLPYGAMIVVFAAAGIFIAGKAPEPWESIGSTFILWCAGIYLAMIAAHLLGWFYHRYEQELNWDV
jgi:hypothetical protein